MAGYLDADAVVTDQAGDIARRHFHCALDQARWIYPSETTRPVASEVPPDVAEDFKQATAVLSLSPPASAALSRRCLQHMLRDHFHVKKGTLDSEITTILDSKVLPQELADSIDAIRNLGNFAAHPIKSTNTGQIVQVEPGEAEWLLDTLEELFQFKFVQPKRLTAKRDALNKKLKDTGKPPLKS